MDIRSEWWKSWITILIISKISNKYFLIQCRTETWKPRLQISMNRVIRDIRDGSLSRYQMKYRKCIIIRCLQELTLPCWCSVYLLVWMARVYARGCNNGRRESHDVERGSVADATSLLLHLNRSISVICNWHYGCGVFCSLAYLHCWHTRHGKFKCFFPRQP